MKLAMEKINSCIKLDWWHNKKKIPFKKKFMIKKYRFIWQ